MSYPFFKMAAAAAQYYFPFRSWWCHCLQKVHCSKSISKPNFVDIPQFTAEIWLLPVWKNKRPPYWNSTSGFDLDHFAINVMLFCMRVPNFVQIGPCTAELWRRVDFQDGCSRPCICFGVMADHPRSAFRGLNSVLKSLVRRINSSGDIAMYRFWRFGLKLPIHAPFGGVFGVYFFHMTSLVVQTPKRTVLWRKHVVWAIQRKNLVRPGRVNEIKYIICNVKFGDLGANGERGKNSSSKVPYLESPTLICLFTMQVLWGYDDD